MNLSRRGFLLGSSALAAAAATLPIHRLVAETQLNALLHQRMSAAYAAMRGAMVRSVYDDTGGGLSGLLEWNLPHADGLPAIQERRL